MKELKKGLSVDLSKVEVVEQEGNNTVIYISGVSYNWNVPYQLALQLIEINNRHNSVIPTP